MEATEILGLVIVLLAFLLPAIRRSRRQRQERQSLSPEEKARIQEAEEESQLRQYEEFLRAMGATEEANELHRRRQKSQAAAPPPLSVPPPVKRPVIVARKGDFQSTLRQYSTENKIAHRELHSKIEDEGPIVSQRLVEHDPEGAYSLNIVVPRARVHEVLSRPESLREMILAREILDRPRGERYELY